MNHRVRLALLGLVAVSLPALHGCIPLVLGTAAGTGVLIAEDRRSSGVYIDDQGVELKAGSRISDKYGPQTHVNVTSFNKIVLLTGEVPDAAIRADVAAIAGGVPGVRLVQNELAIGAASSLTNRARDTTTTANVKSRFIGKGKFQINHVKVVTEAGVVYLMGLVKRAEARDATDIAASSAGVTKVVQVFEFLD